MASSAPLVPTALRKEGDTLVIEWGDGVRSVLPFRKLRDSCPCAACREQHEQPPDPFRILAPAELLPLGLKAVEPVGRYAYRFVWTDGHDTGIFPLDLLRSLGE